MLKLESLYGKSKDGPLLITGESVHEFYGYDNNGQKNSMVSLDGTVTGSFYIRYWAEPNSWYNSNKQIVEQKASELQAEAKKKQEQAKADFEENAKNGDKNGL